MLTEDWVAAISIKLTYHDANCVTLATRGHLSAAETHSLVDEAFEYRKVREAKELRLKLPFLERIPSKLAALDRLRSLSIESFRLSSLAPIATLVELQSLRVVHTRIEDFSSLSHLKNLRVLELIVTPAKELNFLANFQVLEDLNLYGTEVSSATLFSNLKALRTLVLSGNTVTDLEPLSLLQFLQTLRIHNWAPTWPLNDLTPLAQNQSLRALHLDNSQVSDVSPLSGLQQLEYISLNNTRVRDLTPLSGLKRLHVLELVRTPVERLDGLHGTSALEVLLIRGTKISSVTPLAELAKLRRLDISSTSVRDLLPLAGMTIMIDKLFEDYLKCKTKNARRACYALRCSSTPALEDSEFLREVYRLKEPARTIEIINSLRRRLRLAPHYPQGYEPVLCFKDI